MITIAECASDEQALLLKSLLADSGVTAHLPDARSVSYPPMVGSLRVQVAEEDEDTARKILDSQVQ
jgi:Putative prokaryotic signal transducing protein